MPIDDATTAGPPRLHLVTLGVADVAAATAFYERIGLGRAPASNPNVSFFQLGAVVLSLYGRDALAEDAGVAAGGGGFSGVTLAWNQPSPAAVDAACAAMIAAGAQDIKPPAATFWGGYGGYVADPDGHLWEIAHNPFFPFDDTGALRLP
jgi:catechol 2,3-dioxygenase-like lactoylglutathione lyase family enzyme